MRGETEYSEQEIVAGCKKNIRLHQELLYKMYFSKMMDMCHRYTQDPDKTMDIVNNGFLRVFKKIHLFEHRGSLEGWIRRLVFHALSDYFKSENNYLRFLVFEEREKKLEESAVDDLYMQDLMTLVETLPEMTKKVFVDYAIEGYNHREIGERYGISDGTSKWHLSNARKLLKSKITNQVQKSKYAN